MSGLPEPYWNLQSRRMNGRFVKKKMLIKDSECVAAMANANKKTTTKITPEKSQAVCDGPRVVNITALGQNLKCSKCARTLDLDNITSERRSGLHSALTVVCLHCDIPTDVPTGTTVNIDGKSYAEHNLGFIMGSIHSGTGFTGLQKILACSNIPTMSEDLYKRYEKVIGRFIEDEAKDSCRRAATEERHLVSSNVDKICKELPPEVVVDIYPHLNVLRSSHDSQNPFLHQNAPNPVFDCALGDIVNIIVSYDMGWSKRGNGTSYDSLNGYATIIGFLSKKILDYTTQNRKCSKCDAGVAKKDHECRLNFEGSAKAMEADAGVELVTKSQILKDANLNVKVIIGDEDSSMIASVGKENRNATSHKLADKNHLAKNFSNSLYNLGKIHKEILRKGVIAHIKKCFSYAVAQNKGQSTQLATTLRMIPDHLYGNHNNCTGWCNRRNNPSRQTITLPNESLYSDLKKLLEQYANNAHKFSVAASSQSNENFNNVIAHKAPKNICLSRSSSCDFRVASAVCTKNDGEQSIVNIRKKMNLSSGSLTTIFANGVDRKRKLRALVACNKSKKSRRIELKAKREALRKNNEKTEGVEYFPNCGITYPHEESIPFNELPVDSIEIVYFDLETSSLRADCDILQISAISKDRVFNTYINPLQEIDEEASKITGLHIKHNKLYLHDTLLETCTQEEALMAFHQFLSYWNKHCLLVAHNASFDTPRLLRLICNYNMCDQFKVIVGFADTLPVIKKVLSDRSGPGMFELSRLYDDFIKDEFLENNNIHFHDAEFDVTVLQEIVLRFDIENDLILKSKTMQECLKKLDESCKIKAGSQELKLFRTVVSSGIIAKMVKAEMTSKGLIAIYKNRGEDKIVELFTEIVDGKPRVSNNRNVLSKITRCPANILPAASASAG